MDVAWLSVIELGRVWSTRACDYCGVAYIAASAMTITTAKTIGIATAMIERTNPATAIPCRAFDLKPKAPMIHPTMPRIIGMNVKQSVHETSTAKMVPIIPSTRLVTAWPEPGYGGAATTYGYGAAGCT